MNRSLIQERLRNLDHHYQHPSYTLEKKLTFEIREGLLKDAISTLKDINSNEKATLAKNNLRSAKNSLIASCTIFARAVIEAGIEPEDAFSLSDLFIQSIEAYETIADLEKFEFKMLEDFIRLVQSRMIYSYSYPIAKVIRHIRENTANKLSVSELASLSGLSADYLSNLFHKEVGIPLNHYIQERKIELAKKFLAFSDMKVTDISILLEFCNPAYFSNVFKKHTGLSPAQYKQRSLHNIDRDDDDSPTENE